jgi:predicted metal-dependent TIM-barrel fold hydrolase
MSKAGIKVIVQSSFWLGSPTRYVRTFEDYCEHMITFETKRAKEFGIEHFVCISVNPKEDIERPLALDAVDVMVKKGSYNTSGISKEVRYNPNTIFIKIFISTR